MAIERDDAGSGKGDSVPKEQASGIDSEADALGKDAGGILDATKVQVLKYFYDNVRTHLHMVLCFSPVGEKFRDRALKFPALFSGTTIDWFLPWPRQAPKYASER